jgi:putative addiction module killer protein
MEQEKFQLLKYETCEGKCPIDEWLASIKDRKTLHIVEARLNRLRAGLFGDCKSVTGGVYELRIHISSGFRIYFLIDRSFIVLFCGGTKRTQKKDIKEAHKYCRSYKLEKKTNAN